MCVTASKTSSTKSSTPASGGTRRRTITKRKKNSTARKRKKTSSDLRAFVGSRLLPDQLVVASLFVAVLASCGGGGGASSPTPVTNHTVTVAWAPNHEKGVNSTGGGYEVSISGQPTINVPYASGPTAPTSTVTA